MKKWKGELKKIKGIKWLRERENAPMYCRNLKYVFSCVCYAVYIYTHT